jgi:hypothetical protein
LKAAADAHGAADAGEGELGEEGGGGCDECKKDGQGDGAHAGCLAGCRTGIHNATLFDGHCVGLVTFFQVILVNKFDFIVQLAVAN